MKYFQNFGTRKAEVLNSLVVKIMANENDINNKFADVSLTPVTIISALQIVSRIMCKHIVCLPQKVLQARVAESMSTGSDLHWVTHGQMAQRALVPFPYLVNEFRLITRHVLAAATEQIYEYRKRAVLQLCGLHVDSEKQASYLY